MKKRADSINYKKLFFELMIVLSIVFVAVCAILYPVLKNSGAFDDAEDKYSEFRDVVDYVDEYDYSKGRDLELEARLDDAYYNSNNGTKVYAYAMARGTYYCNLKMYNTANAAFEYLDAMASPNLYDEIEAQTRKVLCQRKQQDDV